MVCSKEQLHALEQLVMEWELELDSELESELELLVE
jgi:hypothetical protein